MYWVAAMVSVSAVLGADAPTYNRDIAPIIYEHCANCHRPGAVAPMSLLTYDEARPWAKAMRQAVQDRAMPPWDADPKVGKFSNDISLDADEIAKIVAWVDAGAPAGDPADLPAAPKFPEGWQVGTPDYVVEFPEYSIPGAGADRFPNLIVSLDLPQDSYLRAVELQPGDPRVVHHLVLFHGAMAMSEDVVDLRANKSGMLLNPVDAPNVMYVYAAGSPPGVYPKGMGHKLKAKDTLSMNVHYHPYGEPTTDKSKVGLYFSKEPLTKLLTTAAAIAPALRIPPNSNDYSQRAYYAFSQDSRIISYLPHMHVRGDSIRYVLHLPDGTSQDLLNVPAYDYNWQWIYYPETPVQAPAGSMLEVMAKWDNTSANDLNPAPDQWVQFGEGTNDEMLVGFAEIVPEEGVSPKPAAPMPKLRRALENHSARDSYLVPAGPFSLGLYLPHEGEGMLYISVSEFMLSATVNEIVWDGNNVILNTRMLTGNAGSEPLSLRGTVEGDAIRGTLYFGRELKPGQIKEPAGPGGIEFKGSRVATAVASAKAQ